MGSEIKLSAVTVSFNNYAVLNNLSATFKASESCIIFGTSGTGKSVLFKTLAAFQEISDGTITIDGMDLATVNANNYTDKMDKVGVLFQDVALFDSLTIWENIAFYHLYNLNISRKEARAIALENLNKVGLAEKVMDLLPSQISGGMAKRVGIARVIARKPKVLLFDEPTSGLDPILTNRINKLIAEASKQIESTTFMVTHDISALQYFRERVIFLYKGKIIWDGSVPDFEKSDDPIIRQFLNGAIEGPLDA